MTRTISGGFFVPKRLDQCHLVLLVVVLELKNRCMGFKFEKNSLLLTSTTVPDNHPMNQQSGLMVAIKPICCVATLNTICQLSYAPPMESLRSAKYA